MEKYSFVATQGDLVKQIIQNYPQFNFNQIKSILRKKDVKVNGLKIKQTVFLNGGENVEFFCNNATQKQIPVVYEDANIVVVHKPAGMETTIKDKVFVNSKCLEEYFPLCQAVHRLDKNTEGLVILAKSNQIKDEFINIFKNGEIHKFYTAILSSIPSETSKVLTSYAIRKNKKTIVLPNSEDGAKLIKTAFTVLQTKNNLALVKIELFTGFTHQIRAHMASINCPVLGDDKYGNKQQNKHSVQNKQCLCATKLTFSINPNSPLTYLNNLTFETTPSFEF